MSGKVCANCGKKVIGEYCFEPRCRDYFQKRWGQRVNEKISDHNSKIELFNSYEVDVLKLEDYLELKKIRQEAKEWEKKLGTSPVKSEVETLLQNIEEAEKRFPERILLKAKGKSKDCFHKNIHWTDFFKGEKTEEPYCLDCGEDENVKFTKKFQKWYCNKIEELIQKDNLKRYHFTKFLREKGYYEYWQDLEAGKLVDNIKYDLIVFHEISESIEEYYLEFAKEKGVKVDNTNNNPNHRIKTEQLQQEITNLKIKIKELENKSNKTAKEEQELADKREKLDKLTKPTNNNEQNNSNSWLKSTLIISGMVVLVVIVLLAIKRRRKN